MPQFSGNFIALFLSLIWLLMALATCILAARLGHLRVPGLFPLVLLSSYLAIQLVPLPPGAVEFLSPDKAELYRETIWVFSPTAWMTLSDFPVKTFLTLLQMISFIGLYWVAVQFLTNRNRIKRAAVVILLAGGLQSIIVLSLFLTPRETFLELSPILFRLASDIQEGFAVGFMISIFPLALGLVMAGRPQVRYFPFRERIVQFFRFPGSLPHILYAIPTTIIFAAILIQSSRASMLVLTGTLVLFGMIFLIQGLEKLSELPIVGCLIILGIFALAAGEAGVFEWRGAFPGKLQLSVNASFPESETHTQNIAWPDEVRKKGEFPWKMTDPLPVAEASYFSHLWSPARKGLIEGLCLSIFIAVLLWKTYPVWRRRRNRTSRFLYPGAVAGLLAGIGSVFAGETLVRGGAGYGFFFLAALAVSAACTRSRGASSTELAEEAGSRLPAWAGILAVICLLNAWIFVGTLLRSQSEAEDFISENDQRSSLLRNPLDLGRLNADFRSRLKEGDLSGAEKSIHRILQLNPAGRESLRLAGAFSEYRGKEDDAEKLYRRSVAEERPGSFQRRRFIAWLISRGKEDVGIDEMQTDLTRSPEMTTSYLSLLETLGIPSAKAGEILPERFLSHFLFGDYSAEKGDLKTAKKSYQTALTLVAEEDIPDPSLFLEISVRFRDQENYEAALNALTLGIGKFPGDAELRRSAAVLYERMGLTFRAVEEYRHALLLDPGHEGVRESLERLTQ